MPPPYPFSNIERSDMVMFYYQTHNTTRASEMFHQRYPNLPIPTRRLINTMVHNLREYGQFSVPTHAQARGGDRPARRGNPVNLDQRILRYFLRDPQRSTRQAARRYNVSQSFVWKLLNASGLHPYHFLPVQDISAPDLPLRMNMCRWILENEETNILWTDESTFMRIGLFNVHNEHFWSAENPHLTRRNAYQTRFSLNVWAGVINDVVIGPHFIEGRLNGMNYLDLLREVVPELLRGVPEHYLENLHYQHDGAPAHFHNRVRDYLNEQFPRRWIGRLGPVPWPPRSPDLTPLDFFLWGDVKRLVYEQESNTVEELRQRIVLAFETVKQNRFALYRLKANLRRRAELCEQEQGSHFEQLLKYV